MNLLSSINHEFENAWPIKKHRQVVIIKGFEGNDKTFQFHHSGGEKSAKMTPIESLSLTHLFFELINNNKRNHAYG